VTLLIERNENIPKRRGKSRHNIVLMKSLTLCSATNRMPSFQGKPISWRQKPALYLSPKDTPFASLEEKINFGV